MLAFVKLVIQTQIARTGPSDLHLSCTAMAIAHRHNVGAPSGYKMRTGALSLTVRGRRGLAAQTRCVFCFPRGPSTLKQERASSIA